MSIALYPWLSSQVLSMSCLLFSFLQNTMPLIATPYKIVAGSLRFFMACVSSVCLASPLGVLASTLRGYVAAQLHGYGAAWLRGYAATRLGVARLRGCALARLWGYAPAQASGYVDHWLCLFWAG